MTEYGKSLNEVKVIRNGEYVNILSSEVVAGDIVHIQTGDVMVADGILIGGFDIEIDESTMTGKYIDNSRRAPCHS